jgi:cation:H+ antiporter
VLNIVIDLGLVALGFVLLVGGGEALVKGAIDLAAKLRISPLIIGMTVVAMGTSAPELVVSVMSALSGHADLAIGNVIGSNIANVLLVLGVPALLHPMRTAQIGLPRQTNLMMLFSIGFVGLLFLGRLGPLEGAALLTALAFFLYTCATGSVHLPALDEVNQQLGDSKKDELTYPKMFFWLLLGMGLLPLGADLVVKSGSNLAAALGVSEALIGLTIVALGTSLPELATTVAAAIRKNADIALGNVVGSNIFNMLAIVGITTLIAELTIAPVFLQFDVWVMLVSSLFFTVMVCRKPVIGSKIGMLLLAGYGAYFCKLIVTA